ncbi:hypothetical protein B9Z55_028647 [Caenorhabditis nigoni]|uniref:C-type lectin domain-containing protein n=1 Tax=Caenorhabditis nigoni TaxID=1611254 RepID=A0A2G5SB08_9PELO|nr:hypothetical protein B9Z55_028647 [Caenorhabditis nigoni]
MNITFLSLEKSNAVIRPAAEAYFEHILNSDKRIFEFYGQPVVIDSTVDHITTDALNETLCAAMCYNLEKCVVAYFHNSTCKLFEYGIVTQIEKLDKTSKKVIALKTNMSREEDCPFIFYMLPLRSEIKDLSAPYTEFLYTIDNETESMMTITYNKTVSCAPGYTKFTRPKTEYCLSLYTSTAGKINYMEAQQICSSQNFSVVAGLENAEERLFATEQGSKTTSPDGYKASMFWVSGIRKSSCFTLSQVQSPECAGIKAFNPTDNWLSTSSGYKWIANNPDGVTELGPTQNCVVLWTEQYPRNLHGLVDDATCTAVNTAYGDARGVLCGRVAGY